MNDKGGAVYIDESSVNGLGLLIEDESYLRVCQVVV